MSSKPKPTTVIRDTRSGQFVPKGTEIRRPSTTVKETIKPSPKK